MFTNYKKIGVSKIALFSRICITAHLIQLTCSLYSYQFKFTGSGKVSLNFLIFLQIYHSLGTHFGKLLLLEDAIGRVLMTNLLKVNFHFVIDIQFS